MLEQRLGVGSWKCNQQLLEPEPGILNILQWVEKEIQDSRTVTAKQYNLLQMCSRGDLKQFSSDSENILLN